MEIDIHAGEKIDPKILVSVPKLVSAYYSEVPFLKVDSTISYLIIYFVG